MLIRSLLYERRKKSVMLNLGYTNMLKYFYLICPPPLPLLGLYQWYVKVPKLVVEPELQLQAHTKAAATVNVYNVLLLSHILFT